MRSSDGFIVGDDWIVQGRQQMAALLPVIE